MVERRRVSLNSASGPITETFCRPMTFAPFSGILRLGQTSRVYCSALITIVRRCKRRSEPCVCSIYPQDRCFSRGSRVRQLLRPWMFARICDRQAERAGTKRRESADCAWRGGGDYGPQRLRQDDPAELPE